MIFQDLPPGPGQATLVPPALTVGKGVLLVVALASEGHHHSIPA